MRYKRLRASCLRLLTLLETCAAVPAIWKLGVSMAGYVFHFIEVADRTNFAL